MTRIEVYKAADGWRWRLVHRNGQTLADSGEAYTKRWTAKRAADRFPAAVAEAVVVYA